MAGHPNNERFNIQFSEELMEMKLRMQLLIDAINNIDTAMRGTFDLLIDQGLLPPDAAGVKRDLDHVLGLFPRLEERLHQKAGTLSGGEQQMLAMARAMATDPALLILDELSMGLAPIIVHDLYEQVAEIAAGGMSILVVEQFAHEVLGVADTAAIMLHGRIERTGSPTAIAAALEHAYLSGAVDAP